LDYASSRTSQSGAWAAEWHGWRFGVVVIGLLGLLGLSTGCAPTKVTTDRLPALVKYSVKTVAVLPFEALLTPQLIETRGMELSAPGATKRSDISMEVPSPSREHSEKVSSTVSPAAASRVSGLFYQKLKRWEGLRVGSPDEAAHAMKLEPPGAEGLFSVITATTVAKQLSVDAVLVGKVSVYKERDGSRMGATPAVVGFEVRLIAADGATLWKGNYYERQRPMNEDLWGFFAHGFGFVTAAELAEYGVEQLVKEFPVGAPSPKSAPSAVGVKE
jgi:hypothetical protein